MPLPQFMSQLTPQLLGFIGLLTGLAFLLLTLLLTRYISRIQVFKTRRSQDQNLQPTAAAPGGVILIQSGGRVISINREAKKWFGFSSNKPNLERMASRTRPSNSFLSLCAGEGQAHFAVNGTYVEGTSLRIPYDGSSAMLVSLRRPEIGVLANKDPAHLDRTMKSFIELSQTITSNLDLQSTLRSILESIERLIPCDFPRIAIWDPQNQYLIPYQFIQEYGGERSFEKVKTRFIPGQGYPGYLIAEREALLVNDIDADRTLPLEVDRNEFNYNSFLGMPMLVAGELVGTVELFSLKKGAFSQTDLETLEGVAGHASVAMHNAILYQHQQSRVLELSGLSNLAHAVSAYRDPQDLYTRLVESIEPLLDVVVIGFWIYDEVRHSLEAQIPFMGIPPQFTELFHIDILPNSVGESLLLSQEMVVASNAPEDLQLASLELDTRAQAAGILNTVLAPLSSGGKMLGYLQVADKLDGSSFDKDDLRLLSIIASQAAITIENATLVHQSQSRAQRAEALRRIANLTRSSATLDEILEYSNKELARLLQAHVGAIFLLEEGSGTFWLHKPSLFGVTAETTKSLGRISLDLARPEGLDGPTPARPWMSGDVPNDLDLHAGYRPLVNLFQIHSLIVTPLIVRDRVVGQILLASRNENFFDRNDLILVDTAAGQLAGAIEQSTLLTQTDKNLRRRVDELNAITRINQELNTSHTLEQQLKRVYEELLKTTQASCGSILLIRPGPKLDSPPEIAVQIGEQHAQGFSDIEFSVYQQRKPVLVDEVRMAAAKDANPHVPHSGIRSALVVPITRQGSVIGLIHLHSTQPNHFDPTALEIVQILAIQAAVAIGNAGAQQADLGPWFQNGLDTKVPVEDLNQRAEWIRAGLDIAAIAARQSTSAEVFTALASGMIERMGMDIALVAEQVKGEPHLLGKLGNIPPTVRPETLLGQRNPLRHCVQFGKNILVSDLDQSPEWKHSALFQALNARAFICLAIPDQRNKDREETEDEPGTPVGAVLAISLSTLSPFDTEDEQLFSLLALQVGAAIESLRLVAETERRLQEVNSLLEFSQQLGSLEPASILHTLIASVLKVVPAADACMVATWDPEAEKLVPQLAFGYMENEAALKIRYGQGEALPGLAFEQGLPVKVDTVDFAQHYNLLPEGLLHYRNATQGRLPLSCLVVPIGGSHIQQQDARGMLSPRLANPVGVLVLENFVTTEAFRIEDQHLASSLAHQTALTLENARLFQASEQRAVQLHTLTKVSATITSNLQTNDLISSLLEELKTILRYDTGTLWLRDEEQLKIHAAHGFEDKDDRLGLSVAIEDSQLLKEMIETGCAININDTRQDSRFSSLPGHPYLSWLGVPLLSKGDVIGVIALEKTEAGYYKGAEIELAKTISDQVSIALQNARLFAETQRLYSETTERSNELAALFEVGFRLSQMLDQRQIIDTIIDKLAELLQIQSARVVLKDDSGVYKAHILENGSKLDAELISEEDTAIYEYTLAQEQNLVINDLEKELDKPGTANLAASSVRSWLGIPLMVRGTAVGVLSVQCESTDQFGESRVRLVTQLANQLAVALDNSRLFSTVQSHASDLEKRVETRTSQLGRQYERNQILVSVMSQLSTSLDMDLVLHSTLGLINEKMGAQHSLIMLLQPDHTSLYLRAALGYKHTTPEGGQPTVLKHNEGLVGWVITNRAPALIPDLREDPRWLKLNDENPTYRSAMAVPLEIGEEILGALLLYHQEENAFNNDQLDLVLATAKQIAVAINNSQLYHLIRDQAERLGDMLRSQHVESSRLEAILEAVADGVLVTDANRIITLFNHSAEKILDLSRQQVVGQSLEHFRGVFGKAAQTWVETIHKWSENPGIYPVEDIYNERIELEDGRVISVHLSPVHLQDDFLGTVSIFRDITHQVEVDRLKSEFVATVSHELRTPMTSIKGFVEILLLGAAGSMNEKQVHYLEIVKANSERLAVLVNDLLDISRIETGRVILSLQPLDLYETASKALDELKVRAIAEGRSLQIETVFPPGIPCVHADRERVLQILLNLLENAYLYTPEDGRIILQLQLKDNQVQINIQDNGIGIALKDQAHIFERFYRGEDPRVLAASGTGLGLSIVKRLVEMHHGRIWFASSGKRGEGAVFSFTLPVYEELNR
jgi:PAS domain S-box-containing protein